MKKKNIWILLVILVISTIFLYIYLDTNEPNTLRINEIGFSLEDKVDWIEIYNPTLNNISLKNLYLSDKANEFAKFKITEDVVVPAGGYVVIYGDKYDGELNNSITTNFRISQGETIYLIAEDGSTVIDSLIALTNDEAKNEISVGRYPDGSEDIFIMSENITPGKENIKDSE